MIGMSSQRGKSSQFVHTRGRRFLEPSTIRVGTDTASSQGRFRELSSRPRSTETNAGSTYFFLPAGAAFLRGEPYLERACLRSPTPWQSRTPRTM